MIESGESVDYKQVPATSVKEVLRFTRIPIENLDCYISKVEKKFNIDNRTDPKFQMQFGAKTFYTCGGLYYLSLMDRTPHRPTGYIQVKFADNVTKDERALFIKQSGLMPVGVSDCWYYFEKPGSNPIAVALALQGSRWFEHVEPDFRVERRSSMR